MSWRPHNYLSICWRFFAVNDGLLVDLVKPQVLWCIICKFEHAFSDVLAQKPTLCKGLIKYNKTNDITLMIIHVQTTHLRLFVQRKQLSEKVAKPIAHVQQLGKKRASPFAYAIIAFFGATNLDKIIDEQQ